MYGSGTELINPCIAASSSSSVSNISLSICSEFNISQAFHNDSKSLGTALGVPDSGEVGIISNG